MKLCHGALLALVLNIAKFVELNAKSSFTNIILINVSEELKVFRTCKIRFLFVIFIKTKMLSYSIEFLLLDLVT